MIQEIKGTTPSPGAIMISAEALALLESPPRADDIPEVSAELGINDVLGGWKARWAINRMDYAVAPGIYRVGAPDESSPVLVSANYKMSFDALRKELKGLDAWILVLDTKGVNVWCAAGKGTFGTAELVRRIAMTGLGSLVSHRTLILPQLGAPGVAAHKVKALSGFRVVYGPVRARDIKTFIQAGMKATTAMRRVEFTLMDRLATSPVELVGVLKPILIISVLLFIVHMSGWVKVSWDGIYPFLGAIIIGTVVAPALLPWIPGPAFAWKGGFAGLAWAVGVIYMNSVLLHPQGLWIALAYIFLLPAIAGFLTMNYTGASTYTSLSGVKKEMKYAVPLTAIMTITGLLAGIIGLAG